MADLKPFSDSMRWAEGGSLQHSLLVSTTEEGPGNDMQQFTPAFGQGLFESLGKLLSVVLQQEDRNKLSACHLMLQSHTGEHPLLW